MTREEAIEILTTAMERYSEKSVIRDAFTLALSVLQPSNEPLTPCDLCLYEPPSSFGGKPCSICPAVRRTSEGEGI